MQRQRDEPPEKAVAAGGPGAPGPGRATVTTPDASCIIGGAGYEGIVAQQAGAAAAAAAAGAGVVETSAVGSAPVLSSEEGVPTGGPGAAGDSLDPLSRLQNWPQQPSWSRAFKGSGGAVSDMAVDERRERV